MSLRVSAPATYSSGLNLVNQPDRAIAAITRKLGKHRRDYPVGRRERSLDLAQTWLIFAKDRR